MRKFIYIFGILTIFASCSRNKELCVISTGDVHGAYFHESYIDGQKTNNSLMSVKYYVDSLRKEYGRKNVLLIDNGDGLQGDNSVYYYNYIDTKPVHLHARILSYLGYDAVTIGNHDIETGHEVYDRVVSELESKNIAVLGGNVINTASGKSYFPLYKTFKKAGRKIIVFGFTNAAIKTWLSEYLWEGLDFVSLTPEYVQGEIDKVLKKEKADVVIVSAHTGSGEGDGSVLENQAVDLLKGLKGVDIILGGHDHRKNVQEYNGTYLVNSANKARSISVVTVGKKKKITAKVEDLDKDKIDLNMETVFDADFQKIKSFTNRKIGEINVELSSRDAFVGMSPYINLVHNIMLSAKEAKISFAAPLSQNGVVKKGEVIFNDLFTIYPYENQLFVANLTGQEIKDYLEYSYNLWVQTDKNHVLRLVKENSRWNFANPSFNFDSAAGLYYKVYPAKPYGQRIEISKLSDGTPFSLDAVYPVSMTSYRANGGGDLIIKGAKLSKEEVESRIIARYPDIRRMVADFINENNNIDEDSISNPKVLGHWNFEPQKEVEEKINSELKLIF